MSVRVTVPNNDSAAGSLRAFFEASGIIRLDRQVAQWRIRRQFRRDLRRLLRIGPHMIADIGLTYEDALHETGKWFWQS